MSRTRLASCSALFLLLAACGGGGDKVANPLSDNDLTDAEATAVANQLAAAAASGTQSSTTAHPLVAVDRSPEFSYPVNGAYNCAVAGHITWTGNIAGTVNTTTGAWTVGSSVTFQLGDRTNNLNDCEVSKGVLLDGTIYLVVAGNNVEGVGASMNGQISLNGRGPTGGLVPRGSCWVFLTVPRGGTRATGSVCGHSVN